MNDQRPKLRLCGKKFFLTYPQCDIPKETAFQYLKTLAGQNFDKLVVGHELHQDGQSHLHACLWLKERINTLNGQRYFDLKWNEKDYHGNYQTLRSDKGALMYALKDGDVVASFDWKSHSLLKKAGTMCEIMQEVVRNKRSLIEVIEEKNYALVSRYLPLKNNVEAFIRDKEETREDLPSFLPNPWGKVLVSRRQAKRRHYWIFSRQPDKGKSFKFARPLEMAYKVVVKTGEFTYWNVGRETQAVILDEYNVAKLKYTDINQLCDGTYDFRIFMGGVLRLKDPLIIILSNQSINELYPYMNFLLHARLIEIELI